MVEKSKLGMGLFIASEATFFLFLILAYVYFRRSVTAGPTAANSLDPLKTGIYTIFLLASSLTVWLAGRSLQRGSSRMLRVWLLVTVALGAIFLFGQGREYARLLSLDVTVSRNLFGTTFFTLTGFHGFHVMVGVIALAVLLGLAVAGQFIGEGKERRAEAVEAISMYWHFIDAVWVVIFAVVYLWVLV